MATRAPSRRSTPAQTAAAVAMGGAALVHLAALAAPASVGAIYTPTYPAWRHALFVGIDVGLAWLIMRRARLARWAMALLTLQIYVGHGLAAWRLWQDGRVAWIDLTVVAGSTLLLGLLLANREDGAAPPAPDDRPAAR